jgi:hypothetical protein
MLTSRVCPMVVALFAGGLACGTPASPGAAPQPSVSGEATLNTNESAAAGAILTSFRWAVAHKPGLDHGVFWRSIYGNCDRCGNDGHLTTGPGFGVHSLLDGPTMETLAQHIEQELKLTPVSAVSVPLLYLTNLDMHGDSAFAVITIVYGPDAATDFGMVDPEDGTCLKLTQQDTMWTVVGVQLWVRRLDAPAYQNACR